MKSFTRYLIGGALAATVFGLGALVALAADAPPPPPPPPPPPHEGRPERGPGRMDPEQRLQMMTEQLALTADQQAKLRALFTENAPKMRALREDTTLSPEQRREQMQKLRGEEREKTGALLTAEQKAKWEQMRQQWGHRGEGGPGPHEGAGGPPPPPATP